MPRTGRLSSESGSSISFANVARLNSNSTPNVSLRGAIARLCWRKEYECEGCAEVCWSVDLVGMKTVRKEINEQNERHLKLFGMLKGLFNEEGQWKELLS